jgi:hypothetical protein
MAERGFEKLTAFLRACALGRRFFTVVGGWLFGEIWEQLIAST